MRSQVDENCLQPQITIRADSHELMENLKTKIERVLNQDSPSLALKSDDSYTIVDKEKIDYVEISQGLLTIHVGDHVHTTRKSLASFKSELAPINFLYVSKHAIVNIRSIQRLEVAFSGNYYAFLKSNQKITVSRRFVKELKLALGI